MTFDPTKTCFPWNVEREQHKVEFLEELYEHYAPSNHCYTGLFLRYQKDLAEFVKDWCWIDPEDPRFGKPWLFPVPL